MDYILRLLWIGEEVGVMEEEVEVEVEVEVVEVEVTDEIETNVETGTGASVWAWPLPHKTTPARASRGRKTMAVNDLIYDVKGE